MPTKTEFVSGIDGAVGKIPTANNSSIDTNLIAWRNLQVRLRKSIDGGTTFSNGILSTYSLAYTTVNAYIGGVLAPNGDIHFVPFSAAVGQKISASGVVSTYSLAYTTAGAYIGGVLAPNGDIHFIPSSSTVGQKISASGVISTYSLAYTTANAYRGGVLAPNGDIHFIPFIVAVGQKISTLPAIPFSQTMCESPFFNKF